MTEPAPSPRPPQTADKAWVAAACTLITYLLAVFGLGTAPTPESVTQAAATIGGAIITAGLSGLLVWAKANRDKT